MTQREPRAPAPSHLPVEPVPVPEDVGLRFACARIKGALTGQACAKMWLRWRVEPTKKTRVNESILSRRLAPCSGCEAGAARAMGLGVVEVGEERLTLPRERIVEVPLNTVGILPPPPMTPERLAALDPKAQPIPRRGAKARQQ